MSMFRTLLESMAQDYVPTPPNYPAPTPGVLPSEYQEVEYIQGTGTQYISTEVYPASSKMEYKLKVLVPSGSNDGFAIGSSGNEYLGLNLYNDSMEQSWRNYYSYTATNLSGYSADTSYNMVIILENGYISGTINQASINTSEYNTNESYQTYLFRSFMDDNYYFVGRIYSCQIYQDNTLVRDFIPCYRKSDNEIGMFDIVNYIFYTNDGSGVFIKGNDV